MAVIARWLYLRDDSKAGFTVHSETVTHHNNFYFLECGRRLVQRANCGEGKTCYTVPP